jgi:hypothetical protein
MLAGRNCAFSDGSEAVHYEVELTDGDDARYGLSREL